MKILTCDEVRKAEQAAIQQAGISALTLMYRAGYAIAQFCISQFKFRSVCVVCGKGNNGGDGLVAAGALRSVVDEVTVMVLAKGAEELSPDAAAVLSRLEIQPIWIFSETDFAAPDVQKAFGAELILDAIVGTGFKPPLRGLAKLAVDLINEAPGTIVAVDLPSGIDADSSVPLSQQKNDAVLADGIVTFIAPKTAHIFGELTPGAIAVSELGVSPASTAKNAGVQVVTGKEVGTVFPPRPKDANKGYFGHLLIIGGSIGKAGAAGLAGISALRTGAGLVTVACPRSIQNTVARVAPELMTEGLMENERGTISTKALEQFDSLLQGKDAVVIGPGLSRDEETAEFIRQAVTCCSLPLVLDADGLNAFEGRSGEIKSGKSPFRVLTPHPGEAARLLASSIHDIQENRTETARQLARDTGSCVVLKGHRTLVCSVSGETWINMTGNPALAKGGSGDVLSGIVGAALARRESSTAQNPSSLAGKHRRSQNGHTRTDSQDDLRVAAAVYLHGLAGDLARDALHENSVLATDVADTLPQAFRDCDTQAEQGLFYLQK